MAIGSAAILRIQTSPSINRGVCSLLSQGCMALSVNRVVCSLILQGY